MLDCECFVLVGGQSRRMGKDKAFLPWGKRSLIAHQAYRLSKLFQRVSLVSKFDQPDRFQQVDCPIIYEPDEPKTPLLGIVSSLRASQSEWSFVLAVDLPFFSAKSIDCLSSHRENHSMVLSKSEEAVQALAAYYHKNALEILDSRLESGLFKLSELQGQSDCKLVDVSAYELMNLNTSQEYQKALEIAGLAEPKFSKM